MTSGQLVHFHPVSSCLFQYESGAWIMRFLRSLNRRFEHFFTNLNYFLAKSAIYDIVKNAQACSPAFLSTHSSPFTCSNKVKKYSSPSWLIVGILYSTWTLINSVIVLYCKFYSCMYIFCKLGITKTLRMTKECNTDDLITDCENVRWNCSWPFAMSVIDSYESLVP